MQRIRTEKHGDIYVDGVSWSELTSHGDITIGKLVRGGYVYLPGGEPVDRKEDLQIITPATERQKALDWFDHKDAPIIKDVGRRIIQNPDGSYEFDDGSPIENWEDLLSYYKKGPPQDVAMWLTKKLENDAKSATEDHVALTAAVNFASGKKQKPVAMDMNETGEIVIVD